MKKKSSLYCSSTHIACESVTAKTTTSIALAGPQPRDMQATMQGCGSIPIDTYNSQGQEHAEALEHDDAFTKSAFKPITPALRSVNWKKLLFL